MRSADSGAAAIEHLARLLELLTARVDALDLPRVTTFERDAQGRIEVTTTEIVRQARAPN